MNSLSSFMKLFRRKRMLPFYLAILLFGCTQLEDVDMSEQKRDFPSRTLKNAHIIFKDSGFVKIDLRSPLIEEYALIDSPFTEFRKGLELNYYTTNIDSPGYLRANWAIMKEITQWYEGRGDVKIISEKGDTLKTQKIFWNKRERRVFTNDTVYIISKSGDSLQANNGLNAKDDLSEYSLFNNQGVKFYDEEKL